MGVGACLYMYVVVVQKFTFTISSPDEFLFYLTNKHRIIKQRVRTSVCCRFAVDYCSDSNSADMGFIVRRCHLGKGFLVWQQRPLHGLVQKSSASSVYSTSINTSAGTNSFHKILATSRVIIEGNTAYSGISISTRSPIIKRLSTNMF